MKVSGRATKPRALRPLLADPYESAKLAGLRYISSIGEGITRRKSGTGWRFLSASGHILKDRATLNRIRALVIPPAWTQVWICPDPTGHIQAIGRDARGRLQYRYHALYRQIRDATKFTRMAIFGQALPGIRKAVDADLVRPGLPKRKVVATVVRLLETTYIRVGNEEYRKANDSFGLTTLRSRHVQIEGQTLRFQFRGKSGQDHDIELTDRKLANIVRKCQCLPGYDLFRYVNEEGVPCSIESNDVNDYLREITGQDFTAKDFRTWAGSCLAAVALHELGPAETETEAKRKISEAVKSVAKRLGNRPATCRKYYIHPILLDSYTSGVLADAMLASSRHALEQIEEHCVLSLVMPGGQIAVDLNAARCA